MSTALAIIDATRAAARQQAKEAAIAMAYQTAQQLVGVVVTSEAEASLVADRLSEVKRGQKAAKAALDGVCYVHQQAIDAARGEFADIVKALKDAEDGAKGALQAYIDQRDREARDAQRKSQAAEAERVAQRRREAAEEIARLEREKAAAKPESIEAAELDAAIAFASDTLVAPPMEEPPAEVSTQVRGRKGFAHRRRDLCVEPVDWAAIAAFDVGLLELREAPAKAAFREFIKDAPDLFDPNENAHWNGMMFWYRSGIAAQ